MNTTWQRITLTDLPIYQWRNNSFIYGLVGKFQSWRAGSLLIQFAEIIGVLLLSLLYTLAPFFSKSNDALVPILLGIGVFWLIITLTDEDKIKAVTPIHLLVLLYWSITTISVAFSPAKLAAFKGWNKLTLYLLLFALAARILRSPRLRNWLITIYLHIALIVSAYGIRQWFFGAAQLATWVDPESPLAKTTRVYSFLANPNLLAAYLLPAIALSLAAFFAWKTKVTKTLALTMFVCNSACLILTFSRGGWLGFLLLLLCFTVLLFYVYNEQIPDFFKLWALPSFFCGLILILIIAVIFIPAFRERIMSMFAGSGDSSNNFRLNVWKAVQEMIKASPIIGIGPGNDVFNKIYPLYQVSPKYSALSAYSIVFEICIETGFIGLSCFLWFLIVMFNQAMIQLQRLKSMLSGEIFWLMGAIAAIIGLLTHGLFDTVWYRPQVNSLWWLMVALIASYHQFRELEITESEELTINN